MISIKYGRFIDQLNDSIPWNRLAVMNPSQDSVPLEEIASYSSEKCLCDLEVMRWGSGREANSWWSLVSDLFPFSSDIYSPPSSHVTSRRVLPQDCRILLVSGWQTTQFLGHASLLTPRKRGRISARGNRLHHRVIVFCFKRGNMGKWFLYFFSIIKLCGPSCSGIW